MEVQTPLSERIAERPIVNIDEAIRDERNAKGIRDCTKGTDTYNCEKNK